MNERIKQLMTEVGISVEYLTNTKQIILLEKFAELIVRECSQYIEDKFDFCGDEIIIAESVLKHFGVEE